MARTPNSSIDPSELPLRFGRYELISLLGEGGMAQVFEAELHGPAGFTKRVALKIIKKRSLEKTDGRRVEFFIREARLGGLLKHPNIVDVYELGEVNGQPYIAMEIIEGQTLSGIISSEKTAPPSVILELASSITAGLSSAHSLKVDGLPAGLVHRDLKPSNILLSQSGSVKIADFGIAITLKGELADKARTWTEVYGTLSYMSPEQLLGLPMDGRSDIFSLGLVLAELTLQKALPRRMVYNALEKGARPNRCLLPKVYLSQIEAAIPGLSPLLQRCLHFLPQKRFNTAEELLGAIERLRENHGLFPRLRTWLVEEPPSARESRSEDSTKSTPVKSLEPTATAAFSPDEATGNLGATTAALTRYPNNLGEPLDSFVGRAEELARIEKSFSAGVRLVTLKGTGGTGKTRLATQYALQNIFQQSGGVWLVNLIDCRDAEAIVRSTARVLDIALVDGDIECQVDQVGKALQALGQTLLVVDNFEQVIQCAAGTLGKWLSDAPDARFLVTSREPTRIRGEHVLDLDPLPQFEAARLFEERARAAGAEFTNDPETRETIDSIVDALDRLPLAIELAAARSTLLPPHKLLERLSQRFRLLRGGSPSTAEHQGTLYKLIDWSWSLLEPWEKQAMAQLSVFQNGFFMEAAEEVLDLSKFPDAPWPLDVVGALYDKSLLHRKIVDNQPRFGMFVSIQAFAAGHLKEDAQATRIRVARHFSRLGSPDNIGPLRGKDRLDVYRGLVLELQNLLLGADVPEESAVEASALCALAASHVFRIRGPYADGIALLEQAIAKPIGDAVRWHTLHHLARMCILGSRLENAGAYLDEALEICQKLGDEDGELSILMRRNHYLSVSNQLDEMEACSLRGIELSKKKNDKIRYLIFLAGLGTLKNSQEKPHEALPYLLESVALARVHLSERDLGVILGNAALVQQCLGKDTEAEAGYLEAIDIAERQNNRLSEAVNTGNLAILYANRSDFETAQGLLEKSLELTHGLGDRLNRSQNLWRLGEILVLEGSLDEAGRRFDESIELSIQHPVWQSMAQSSKALVLARKHSSVDGWSLIEAAEEHVQKASSSDQKWFYLKKAQVAQYLNKFQLAQEAFARATAISEASSTSIGTLLARLHDETKQMLDSQQKDLG